MERERSKETHTQNEVVSSTDPQLDTRSKGRSKYSIPPTLDLSVLVISKPFDENCNESFLQVLSFLKKQGVNFYTNKTSLEAMKDDPIIKEEIKPKIYTDQTRINRVITLGGDGTILFAIKLFYNKCVPPIISFGLGSVGYLCAFDSDNIIETLKSVLINTSGKIKKAVPDAICCTSAEKFKVDANPYLDFKDRLKVTLTSKSKKEKFLVNSSIFGKDGKEFDSGSTINALNEFSLEAEAFHKPFTVSVYINETFLTEITACGLILSTSTGSTAYGMSAGGSIVQTGVEAICISAVNPASISFRPLILPFKCRVTLKIPKDVNEHNFGGVVDGDFKFKCTDEDEITIEGSSDPVPFVSKEKEDEMTSWVKRLSSTVLSY